MTAKELLVVGRMGRRKIFLLSPASCGGKRAALLFNQHADFEVAKRVRAVPGAPLGEVFSFLSGLYFRGKLAYAKAFQNPPARVGGIHIITPTDGLRAPGALTTLDDLERFAEVPIEADEPRYRIPLDHDAHALSKAAGDKCDAVLLGSIATGKYVDILLPIFGARLLFPREFLGHGDMARGGMLLKRAASGEEFSYLPVSDPSRLGTRARKARVDDARLEAEP